MCKITFIIPGSVPSVNELYLTRRRYGGKILTRRQRDFRERVKQVVGASRCPYSFVEVVIRYRPPDRRKRDVDNYIKAIFDALTVSEFWEDDSIVSLVTSSFLRPTGAKDAEVIVEIRPSKEKYTDEV